MIHMLKYVFLTTLKTNVKVFNLVSRTNETRHIKWHKTCKCECKELIDKGICDKGFIWDPSNNCKCRKRIIDKLVEECTENIYKNETLDSILLSDYKNVCSSCTICIVLFVIF